MFVIYKTNDPLAALASLQVRFDSFERRANSRRHERCEGRARYPN
jgi:hypothetical protein